MKKSFALSLSVILLVFLSCKKNTDEDNPSSVKKNEFNYKTRLVPVNTFLAVYDTLDGYYSLMFSEGTIEQTLNDNCDYIGIDLQSPISTSLESGTYTYSTQAGVPYKFDEAWFYDSYHGEDPDAIGGRVIVNKISDSQFEISFTILWQSISDTTFGYFKGPIIYHLLDK